MEKNLFFTVVTVVLGTHCPCEEEEISDNTDDPIGHEGGSKLFKFDDKDHGDEHKGIDNWVEGSVLVIAGKPFPLYDYKFVVKNGKCHEGEKNTELIEHSDFSTVPKMSLDCYVHIWVISCVEYTDVAWVITDESGDQEYDESEEPSWLKCHNR